MRVKEKKHARTFFAIAAASRASLWSSFDSEKLHASTDRYRSNDEVYTMLSSADHTALVMAMRWPSGS